LFLAPYLQVTWHSACAMAIFVYIMLLNIIMAVKQAIVNVDTFKFVTLLDLGKLE